MPEGLKKLLDEKRIKSMLKQYRHAQRFWNSSPESDDKVNKQRRGFVTAYQDDIKAIYQETYGKRNANAPLGIQEKKEYEQKFQQQMKELGLQGVLEDYQWMLEDNKWHKEKAQGQAGRSEQSRVERRKEQLSYAPDARQENKSKLVEQDPLEADPSLTEEQKKGLKEFHQWLYRNCDKTGAEILGSDGTMRNLAEDFMSRPAKDQLKALYLLETNKRKKPSEIKQDDRDTLENYVPQLDNLKDRLVATKWKFWKRRNGHHLYWEKLQDVLNQVEDPDHPLNNEKTNAEDYKEKDVEAPGLDERMDQAAEVYGAIDEGVGDLENLKDLLKETELVGDFSGAMKKIGNLAGVAGVGLHIGGSLISIVTDSAKLVSGAKVRGGEKLGLINDLASDVTGGASSTNDMVAAFVAEGSHLAENVELAGGILGTVSGAFYLTKAGIAFGNQLKYRSEAKEAVEVGKKLNDDFLIKTGKWRQRQISREHKSTALMAAMGSTWLGGSIAVLCGAAGALPMAGAIVAGMSVGQDLYEGIVEQKRYRDTVDTYLFNDGKDLKDEDQKLCEKLKKRKEQFDKDSQEYKDLDNLCSDAKKETRYDIIRRNALKDQKCWSFRSFHEKQIDKIGEVIISKCFKNGTKDFILNEEKERIKNLDDKTLNPEELKKKRELIGYKQLAKSFGIDTKMMSKHKTAAGKEKEENNIKARVMEGVHR